MRREIHLPGSHGRREHMCACVWWNAWTHVCCPVLPLSTLFPQTGSLTESGACCFDQLWWPASPQEASSLPCPFQHCRVTGYTWLSMWMLGIFMLVSPVLLITESPISHNAFSAQVLESPISPRIPALLMESGLRPRTPAPCVIIAMDVSPPVGLPSDDGDSSVHVCLC